MSTDIEWTDETWNPVRGCSLVSEGCRNCYAMKQAHRFNWRKDADTEVNGIPSEGPYFGLTKLGPNGPVWTGAVKLVPEKLYEPLHWREPRRVFVNSMSDLFHVDVPDDYIDRVFAVMALAPQHTFQILTKRAARMLAYFAAPDVRERVELQLWERHTDDTTNAISAWPLPNVWLGVSCENQHFADERIPLLLQTPAAVRFISAEPLLGPVNLAKVGASLNGPDWHPLIGWKTSYQHKPRTPDECAIGVQSSSHDSGGRPHPKLDWVIVGGESGPGARPCDVAWVRCIVAQCKAAGVACFVKQLGANPQERIDYNATPFDGDADVMSTIEPLHLRNKKGGDMAEWPADLRVRQFPEGLPE